jgi:OPA family glycerol-3-phosphate transporter-like MFS transporter 3
MVDIGTFIGGMGVGYLGDRYSYRALFLTPFLALSSIVMFIVSFALTDVAWTYYLALFFIGLMIGGPYNIIGTAITIDLGEQAGKKNIAKVSALIEGSAAGFAALSQILISIMPFSSIFYLFCG